MKISWSFPARLMRCLDTEGDAPDLETNGVKVQVRHMNLLYHASSVLSAPDAKKVQATFYSGLFNLTCTTT